MKSRKYQKVIDKVLNEVPEPIRSQALVESLEAMVSIVADELLAPLEGKHAMLTRLELDGVLGMYQRGELHGIRAATRALLDQR